MELGEHEARVFEAEGGFIVRVLFDDLYFDGVITSGPIADFTQAAAIAGVFNSVPLELVLYKDRPFGWARFEPQQPETEEPPAQVNLGEDEWIDAWAHSDDYVVDIGFNAARYFAQASDEDTYTLFDMSTDNPNDRVGGNYEGDAVADFCSDDPRVKPLFDYVNMERENTVGFECYVDADQLLTWLKEYRPQLYPVVRRLWDERDY